MRLNSVTRDNGIMVLAFPRTDSQYLSRPIKTICIKFFFVSTTTLKGEPHRARPSYVESLDYIIPL